ncbi:hypothetical protein ACFQ48_18615 [Hymenobacter caeli]|uniref:Uncharacterized protein n=1 Tax=Hymenobacter caeli TaxID=2735894 RepID=A0ABX2FWY7_9BACT|nr:hypothetical protein [Hymenobacter caeli]NRT20961.1 hypothetical protein [Hymenobacter caeli]
MRKTTFYKSKTTFYKQVFVLPAFVVLAGCQSGSEKAAEVDAQILTKAAEKVASSPQEKARQDAWKTATTLPQALSPAAVDLTAGVKQLLPAQGYLELVSATPQKIEPALVRLPGLWASLKPNYPQVAPGYRIPFEAVVKWKPTGYRPGERVPATIALYSPNGRDSLAGWQVAGANPNVPGAERYTISEIRPNEPVTVRGTLYAFAGQDPSHHPLLVVYPYHHANSLPDARQMVTLPIRP